MGTPTQYGKKHGKNENKAPVIALDGPSAMTLYRDRDDHRQKEEPPNRRAARSVATRSDRPVASDTTDDLACDWEDWEEYEEYTHLSDEDIAAELEQVAGMNVYGCSIKDDWNDESDTNGIPSADSRSSLLPLERTRRFDLARCASHSSDIKNVPFEEIGVQPPLSTSPLFLLVRSSSVRRVVKDVRQRVCGTAISPDCFKMLGGQVLVPTPEFCFLLLATHVGLVELIQIGMEMCGHYRLVGATSISLISSSRTIYNCDPLTTPLKISTFLDGLKSFPGIEKARRAARYIASGSASPMETILYMLVCLPRSMGGYALPKPSLNAKRRVSKRGSKFTLSRTLIPDLYWAAARLDVEYDSEEFHADEDALDRGARRTMALRSIHVDVFSMTGDLVHDEMAFDAFAHLLARRLGKRIRNPDASTLLRRHVLRAALLR